MQIAILAHDQFPDRAKTAIGVMRYGQQEVIGVLDRSLAGTSTNDHTQLVPDVPIVESIADLPELDALVIGIAPIGGGFDESWRNDIVEALERGCDVIAGLHEFLGEDPQFVRLAEESGATITDIRSPPADLSVSTGMADTVDATVLLTVGTDASVGKMTTTFELVEGLQASGVDAAAIPTGQTGIMIDEWGYPVDRVVADFIAGSVEELILERGDDHDVLVVEGQGSITHPAYSGVTCGILHGAMPDGLILCHDAKRTHVSGYESFELPAIDASAELYRSLADPVKPTTIIGGSLDTSGLSTAQEARVAIDDMSRAIGVPVTDPIRFGVDPLVEGLQ